MADTSTAAARRCALRFAAAVPRPKENGKWVPRTSTHNRRAGKLCHTCDLRGPERNDGEVCMPAAFVFKIRFPFGNVTNLDTQADSNHKGYAMSMPDYLTQLIEKASAAAGSDYALAKRIGTSRQTVSNWKHGHKPCPVGDVALMADIAGMDGEAWAARAIVAQYEGTEKGKALAKVLGKALAATGAILVSSGTSAAWVTKPVSYFIRCIEVITNRHLSPAPV